MSRRLSKWLPSSERQRAPQRNWPKKHGSLLLGEAGDAERGKLAELLEKGVAGPDAVAWTALASRKAGGESWERFRAASSDLLGDQPLPGELLALVNHLPTSGVIAAGE